MGIDILHRVVHERTHRGGFEEHVLFLFRPQALYILQVERPGTRYIGVQRRRREAVTLAVFPAQLSAVVEMQGGEDRTRSEVDLRSVALDHAALLDRTARHLKLRRVQHLHDKPRHAFAAFHGVRRCVQERRLSRAAQEAEEVIGINRRLLVGGLHVVGLAQVERYKTEVRLFLRDDAFLDVQQQQPVEVQ